MNVKSLKDLREIILLEEFKRSVHVDVRTHLEEREVRTLSEAARIADDFVLTHKSTSKVLGNIKKGGKWHKNKSESYDKNEVKTLSKEKQKKTGERKCFACDQEGHFKADCPMLKKKHESEAQPMGLVNHVTQSRRTSVGSRRGRIKSVNSVKIQAQYEPFISVGYVSLVGCDRARKVRILRDTGASQSLVLKSVLPFDAASSTGSHVLLQGFGGSRRVPLHVVDFHCDLVSGEVVFAVQKTLPVQGVSIILENDLAEDKVKMSSPVVGESPLKRERKGTIQVVDQHSDVFPTDKESEGKAGVVNTIVVEKNEMKCQERGVRHKIKSEYKTEMNDCELDVDLNMDVQNPGLKMNVNYDGLAQLDKKSNPLLGVSENLTLTAKVEAGPIFSPIQSQKDGLVGRDLDFVDRTGSLADALCEDAGLTPDACHQVEPIPSDCPEQGAPDSEMSISPAVEDCTLLDSETFVSPGEEACPVLEVPDSRMNFRAADSGPVHDVPDSGMNSYCDCPVQRAPDSRMTAALFLGLVLGVLGSRMPPVTLSGPVCGTPDSRKLSSVVVDSNGVMTATDLIGKDYG